MQGRATDDREGGLRRERLDVVGVVVGHVDGLVAWVVVDRVRSGPAGRNGGDDLPGGFGDNRDLARILGHEHVIAVESDAVGAGDTAHHGLDPLGRGVDDHDIAVRGLRYVHRVLGRIGDHDVAVTTGAR